MKLPGGRNLKKFYTGFYNSHIYHKLRYERFGLFTACTLAIRLFYISSNDFSVTFNNLEGQMVRPHHDDHAYISLTPAQYGIYTHIIFI